MKQIYTDSSFIYPARRNGIKELRVFESKSDFTRGHGEGTESRREDSERYREGIEKFAEKYGEETMNMRSKKGVISRKRYLFRQNKAIVFS